MHADKSTASAAEVRALLVVVLVVLVLVVVVVLLLVLLQLVLTPLPPSLVPVGDAASGGGHALRARLRRGGRGL